MIASIVDSVASWAFFVFLLLIPLVAVVRVVEWGQRTFGSRSFAEREAARMRLTKDGRR